MGIAHQPGLQTSSVVHIKDTGGSVAAGLYEVDATLETPAAMFNGQFGGVIAAVKEGASPTYTPINVPIEELDLEYVWSDSWDPHLEGFKVTLPDAGRYAFAMLYF